MRDLAQEEKSTLIFLSTLSLGQALAIAGFSICLAYLLAGLAGYRETDDSAILIGLLILFGFMRIAFSALTERLSTSMGIRRRMAYRRQLLRIWFDPNRADLRPEHTTGDRLAIFEDGTRKIELFYQRFVPASLQVSVIPLVLVAAALFLDFATGLILLITGPLIPVFMILIGKGSELHIKKQWGFLQSLNRSFLTTLRAGVDLLVHGKENWVRHYLDGLSETFRVTTVKILAVAFLSALVLEIFAMIGVALVAAQTGVRLVEGWMEFAPALAVLLLAPEFYLPFRTLGSHHHAGMEAAESAVGVFAELDQKKEPVQKPQATLRGKDSGLVVEGVSFSWPDQAATPLFEDLFFALEANQTGAIIGPSGVGKTTLFRLIMGLESIQSGDIRIGSQSIHETPGSAWRESLCWVPQSPSFFPGSLRDNITMGNTDVSDQKISEALDRAKCQEILKNLPEGLDTPISESALSFSAGERQRLAIARALLRESPTILLDEPTASLDPESERDMIAILQDLKRDHTLLIIAHRRKTIALADTVWLIKDGAIQRQEGAL